MLDSWRLWDSADDSLYNSFTDLALACEKGICFLDHQRPTEAPQQVEGLPDTLFAQVVCSELMSSVSTTATAITMFAISGRGELYFVEGQREWATGTIKLKSSGLPIRANVTRVSCQYNAKLDSSELIYAGAGDDQVSHLLRDPVTKCWSDDVIRFPVPKAITNYRAFVTTLSLKSTTGRPLGGFSIGVQSQPAIVLINDRSYVLSNSSTEVMSNNQGQLVIVAASMDSLAAPTYTFVVTYENISHAEQSMVGRELRAFCPKSRVTTPYPMPEHRLAPLFFRVLISKAKKVTSKKLHNSSASFHQW